MTSFRNLLYLKSTRVCVGFLFAVLVWRILIVILRQGLKHRSVCERVAPINCSRIIVARMKYNIPLEHMQCYWRRGRSQIEIVARPFRASRTQRGRGLLADLCMRSDRDALGLARKWDNRFSPNMFTSAWYFVSCHFQWQTNVLHIFSLHTLSENCFFKHVERNIF